MDHVDNIFVVVLAAPGVIGWILGLFFGASIMPIAMAVALSVELIRGRLKRGSASDAKVEHDHPLAMSRDFRVSDLRSVPAIIALSLVAAELLAMTTFAYAWAWTIFAVSSVVCAIYWLRLRREGVRHAEVYALAAWMLPRLAWAVFVLVRATYAEYELYAFFLQYPLNPAPAMTHIFGGRIMFSVALVVASFSVGIAVWAALRGNRITRIAAVACMIPSIVYFWFVEPFGFTHGGFTLMVIGYAISREMRRVTIADRCISPNLQVCKTDGNRRYRDKAIGLRDWIIVFPSAIACLAVVAFLGTLTDVSQQITSAFSWAVFAAGGIVAFLVARALGSGSNMAMVATVTIILSIVLAEVSRDVPRLFNPEVWDDVAGFTAFVTSQAIAAGLLGNVGLLVTIVTRAHPRYGALCLGVGTMCTFAWTFDVFGGSDPAFESTFVQWFGATIVVSLALWAMWHLFGPGSRRDNDIGQSSSADS